MVMFLDLEQFTIEMCCKTKTKDKDNLVDQSKHSKKLNTHSQCKACENMFRLFTVGFDCTSDQITKWGEFLN